MVGSRVYVGGLPYGVRERDLERFFKGYGRTRDILIKNGYGFVEFEDYRDADDAVYELNGKELLGERVVVEPARGQARGSHRDRYNDGDRYSSRRGGRYNNDKSSSRYGPPLRTEYRLIVENLSSRVSWQDLKDYMRQAGEVTYADAHKQRRNEGVVEFASSSDMKTAIEKLDDTELNGRRIRLVEDRRGGRGRGRSRSSSRSSRSRSRSRSRRRRSSSRSRSPRSRSKSRGGRSKSKSPKSRSRSKSNNRDLSKSKSKSRSRSRDSRSRSRSHKRGDSRDSRDRSLSKGSKDRHHSRSSSPKNNGGSGSPDRNESMDD